MDLEIAGDGIFDRFNDDDEDYDEEDYDLASDYLDQDDREMDFDDDELDLLIPEPAAEINPAEVIAEISRDDLTVDQYVGQPLVKLQNLPERLVGDPKLSGYLIRDYLKGIYSFDEFVQLAARIFTIAGDEIDPVMRYSKPEISAYLELVHRVSGDYPKYGIRALKRVFDNAGDKPAMAFAMIYLLLDSRTTALVLNEISPEESGRHETFHDRIMSSAESSKLIDDCLRQLPDYILPPLAYNYHTISAVQCNYYLRNAMKISSLAVRDILTQLERIRENLEPQLWYYRVLAHSTAVYQNNPRVATEYLNSLLILAELIPNGAIDASKMAISLINLIALKALYQKFYSTGEKPSPEKFQQQFDYVLRNRPTDGATLVAEIRKITG